MSNLLLNAQANDRHIYGAWFNPNDKNEFLVVTKQTHARVIDVSTGTTKKMIKFKDHFRSYMGDTTRYNEYDYNNQNNTNLDEKVVGHYQDGSDIYIITSGVIYKFSFNDYSFIEYNAYFDNFVDGNLFNGNDYREIKSAAISSLSGKLVIGGFDSSGSNYAKIEIYDLSTETKDWDNQLASIANSSCLVDISPDSNTIVAGVHAVNESDRQSDLRVYDVATGASSEQLFKEHNSYIESINFLDNSTVATGDNSGTFIKWDTSTLNIIEKFSGIVGNEATHFEFIDDMEDSKIGASLTNSGDDLTFNLPDTNIKDNTYTFYEDTVGDITSDVSSIDLVNGSVTFSTTHTNSVTADYVYQTESSASGNLVAVSGSNAKIYDRQNGNTYLEHNPIRGYCTDISISADKEYAVITGSKGDVAVYNIESNLLVRKVSNITDTSMRVTGEVISMSGYDSLDCYFEYSDTQDFSSNVQTTSVVQMTSSGKFSIDVTGLNPNTTYYFRAKATETV